MSRKIVSLHSNSLKKINCAYITSELANDKEDWLPENADFNGDKKINVRDAAAIARWLANSFIDKV